MRGGPPLIIARVFRVGIIIDDVTRRSKRSSPIRGRRRIVGGVCCRAADHDDSRSVAASQA
jgi:hypothetical protein